MNKSVIIVAGGSGSRMGAETPKQFLLLNGLPVLMHTIQRFYEYNSKILIITVLPENEIETWKKLVRQFSFLIPHTIVAGGQKRFHSVKNGLLAVQDCNLIAVHDGVRPLCTNRLIKRCFDEAELKSNAIPAIRITETIRKVDGDNNSAIERDSLRIIQTPQCFDATLLMKAYQYDSPENFTDDAGVFENDGNKIHLVEGEKNNIKITYPEDLIIASSIEKYYFSKSEKKTGN